MKALYGYVLTAFLIALIVTSAVSYRRGSSAAATKARVEMAKHLEADTKAELKQKDHVLGLERKLTAAQNDASQMYERGKKDAEITGAAVTADLRAGNLQLQKRWAGCETQRLSGATTSTGEFDATTRDRDESAGRIIRAAAQCDSQVKGLQELLTNERSAINNSSQR